MSCQTEDEIVDNLISTLMMVTTNGPKQIETLKEISREEIITMFPNAGIYI